MTIKFNNEENFLDLNVIVFDLNSCKTEKVSTKINLVLKWNQKQIQAQNIKHIETRRVLGSLQLVLVTVGESPSNSYQDWMFAFKCSRRGTITANNH